MLEIFNHFNPQPLFSEEVKFEFDTLANKIKSASTSQGWLSSDTDDLKNALKAYLAKDENSASVRQWVSAYQSDNQKQQEFYNYFLAQFDSVPDIKNALISLFSNPDPAKMVTLKKLGFTVVYEKPKAKQEEKKEESSGWVEDVINWTGSSGFVPWDSYFNPVFAETRDVYRTIFNVAGQIRETVRFGKKVHNNIVNFSRRPSSTTTPVATP